MKPAARGETEARRQARLLRWVGGQLKQPGCVLPPAVQADLVDDPYMRDALDNEDRTTRGDLLKAARTFLADFRARERQTRVKKRRQGRGGQLPTTEQLGLFLQPQDQVLDPREAKRLRLLARELARIAERQPRLPEAVDTLGKETAAEAFRNRYLGGRILSKEEANAFLGSVAVWIFEYGFFRDHGISIVGHESRNLTPPDFEADEHTGVSPKTAIEITWGTQSLTATVGDRSKQFRSSYLGLPGAPYVTPGSVIDGLEYWARELCDSFPWTPDGAAMFILTGRVPDFPAIWLDSTTHSRSPSHALTTIQMTIHPWLSAKTVLRAYQRIQRTLIGHRNRPPMQSSLEFFEFVSDQRHRGVSWSAAMKAWVTSHPAGKKKYPHADEDCTRRFARDFKDIERQLLWPFAGGFPWSAS